MTRFVRRGLILLTLAGIAAAQEKKAPSLFAQNTEHGIQIQAPPTGGKDQLWEAQVGKGAWWSDAHVSVNHRVDSFAIDVIVQRLAGKDPMREGWKTPAEIAKGERDGYLDKRSDGSASHWKEMRVKSEDPKAKISGLPGKGHQHHIVLIDEKEGKKELIQYFVISSEVLYVVTLTFDDEGYKKYWAREGQMILGSIKKCKVEKKK